jgi:uncharacterized protein YjiS (DUF1127 family)
MSDFSARFFMIARTACTRTAAGQARPVYLWLLDTLRVWGQRNRQRHALRLLTERDDCLLKDIGLSRDDALREAEKPFWQR